MTKEKNIIIIGATSAIAHATARLWAIEGASFFLVARSNEQLEISKADLIARGARRVITYSFDLSNLDLYTDLYQAINNELPNFNLVLIAHAVLGDQEQSRADSKVLRLELDLNLMSPILLANELSKKLEQAKSGTLAIITSVAGDRGRKSNYHYGTAKGALNVYLQGLRNYLFESGVQVLTIKPGFVDTPMTAAFKKGLLFVKPDVIAEGIVAAVAKQKDVVYLPNFWFLIMFIIKSIPERIFKRLSI